ncbi:hypothetical protein T492DRAFT_1015046 [Pavlovales sp. CCMP2436]|nr:hypothetical protein T492DRAFT_1015046 [Pavlovales sp. CCMP2436]
MDPRPPLPPDDELDAHPPLPPDEPSEKLADELAATLSCRTSPARDAVRQGEDSDSDCEQDARLQLVFHGVNGAPRVGEKRKGALRPSESHSFFYGTSPRRPLTLPAPPAALYPCSTALSSASLCGEEDEARLMESLGLPTALVRGSAMSNDVDGRAYAVICNVPNSKRARLGPGLGADSAGAAARLAGSSGGADEAFSAAK